MLRVFINGEWSANDFVVALHSIDRIYDVYREIYRREFLQEILLREEHFDLSSTDPNQEAERISGMLMEAFPPLMVKRMAYASPGIQDLTGAGKILEQLRLIITDWRNRGSASRVAKAEASLAEAKVVKARIKNMSEFFRVCRENGFSDLETKRLWAEMSDAQSALLPLVESGKIEGAADERKFIAHSSDE
ncbi:MAG: hypothetical protein QNJ09_07845 [Paracoccaceae bacterium]|nr:hypothetical protein [Paracoccaceae bacterium]